MLCQTLILLYISILSCLCEIVITPEFIDWINSRQKFWRAGNNSLKYIVEGGTADPDEYEKKHNISRSNIKVTKKPTIDETFDAREKWPKCKILNRIPSQGQCKNCWAMASAAGVADRMCIESKGQRNFQLSAEDLTTCCKKCAAGINGCYKGYVFQALKYALEEGIVSGGHYRVNRGCKPYSEKLHSYLEPEHPPKLRCIRECTNDEYYENDYDDDKIKIYMFRVLPKKKNPVKIIQQNIIKFGPVIATFQFYRDFYAYQDGVYVHQTEEKPTWHTINIMGWGTENGIKYWLVRNTFGKGWGKLGGFFKIKRGTNEGRIEGYVSSVQFRSDLNTKTRVASSFPVILPNFLKILTVLFLSMILQCKIHI